MEKALKGELKLNESLRLPKDACVKIMEELKNLIEKDREDEIREDKDESSVQKKEDFGGTRKTFNKDTAERQYLKKQSSDTKDLNEDVEEAMSDADDESIDNENVDNFKKNLDESLFLQLLITNILLPHLFKKAV